MVVPSAADTGANEEDNLEKGKKLNIIQRKERGMKKQ